jgi:two-component system NarL family sensor kinase
LLTRTFLSWKHILLCGCLLWAACNGERQHGPDRKRTDKINAFKHRLDSIAQISDDSLKSVLIRDIYSDADPKVRNAAGNQMFDILKPILLYNNNADPGLHPFFCYLSADSSLPSSTQIQARLQLANFHAYVTQDADSARLYLERIKGNPGMLDDSANAKFYSITAQTCQLRGQPKEAVRNYYKSIQFNEKIKDSASLAGTYVNLANAYRMMEDYDKSIALRMKALNSPATSVSDNIRATALQGLASDYLACGEMDSAAIAFNKAEALFAKGLLNPGTEYYLYLGKAGMYVTLNKFDSSILYFDKAKEIVSRFNDPRQEMLFIMTSAIAYAHVRNVAEEATMIEDYIPKLLGEEDLLTATHAYFSLYNISLVQHIRRDPLDYYLSYDSLNNVLAANTNREFVAEMESRYESQKKTFQIDAQRKEIEKRETINLILGLSIITLALLGGFIIARLQLLRTRKEARLQQKFTLDLLTNTEDERRRIAGELHDGIGHELLTLKNNLQQDVPATENRIDTIINDVRMLSRNLHPVMLEQIGLEHSIRYLCDQVMSSSRMFVSAEIDYHGELSRNDELQLYRIVQESLSNAIKYSGAIAARIEISAHQDKIIVTVMDNGHGFDVADKLSAESAFGLNSMIQRGKALGGKTSISSTGEGTIVHLEIPLKHAVNHHS